MAGRNPKPVHLQLMEGNVARKSKAELERLQKNEEKLKFDNDAIKPPSWLSAEGKKLFKKLVNDFTNTNLLVNVDNYALALFCDAYCDYVRFTKIIEEEGDMLEHTNKSGNMNIVPHPLMTKKAHAFAQVDKLMGKFGLSPIDRAKLVQNMPTEEEVKDDPFSDRL